MIKRLCIASALSFLSLQTACSFGNGTADGCATSLTGTYEGISDDEMDPQPVSGLMFGAATIDEDGDQIWLVSLVDPDDTPETYADNSRRSLPLLVDSDGVVTAKDDSIALELPNTTMNLDTCVMTGEWDALFIGTGSFTIGPYQVY